MIRDLNWTQTIREKGDGRQNGNPRTLLDYIELILNFTKDMRIRNGTGGDRRNPPSD